MSSLSPKLRAALLRSVLEQVKRECGVEYDREVRFHPTRRWRFDAAIWTTARALHGGVCEVKWGLEVDGGGWVNGRHNRESGRVKEREKYNEAALLGWRVLSVAWREVENGTCLSLLRRACGGEG